MPVLDARQQLRRAVGGGRLVAGERVGVVAPQRLQVADRGVQRGAARGGRARARRAGARAPRRWRTARARRRRRARTPRPPRRRGPRAADGGRPPPCGPGERVGRAAVQQAAAGEAGLLVDERSQPLVREVVVEAALADQPAADELLERGDGLLVAAAAGGAHGPDVERAPDHRGGGEDLARGLADGSRRASSSSRAPAGTGHAGSAPSVLRYSTSRNGSPSVSS